jgi:hypothetical protein
MFLVEASTNLTDWVPLGTVAVRGYLGQFQDPDGASWPMRFYRAVLQSP